LLEETGLSVVIKRCLGYADAIQRDPGNRVQWHYVIHYFEVEALGMDVQAADDAGSARWVTPQEARNLQVTDAVERCLKWVGL